MRIRRALGLIFLILIISCFPCMSVSVQAVEVGDVHHQASSPHMSGGADGHGVAVADHGAGAGEAHGEGGAGHGAHHGVVTHSQVMNFLWHCLNFTLLVLVLIKFLKAPLSKALASRTEEIEKAFSDLEQQKKDAEKKYAEYEKKLSEMDKEAERILSSFIRQGEEEKEKIIHQAREAAERIKAQAELYVQQELEKARQELRREMADIAVSMAKDIIRKNLTEQDHHKLISEYIEKVVTKN